MAKSMVKHLTYLDGELDALSQIEKTGVRALGCMNIRMAYLLSGDTWAPGDIREWNAGYLTTVLEAIHSELREEVPQAPEPAGPDVAT
jgi:hypothetical protein